MKLTCLKKTFLALIALSTLAGCVSPSTRAANQAMDNYFAQQAYADNTPLQSWKEMRSESEIKEVFEEDWTDRLERLQKASEARSRKGLNTAADKNTRAGKTANKTALAKPRQDGNSQ